MELTNLARTRAERNPLASRRPNASRDALWEHCRNSLGIARLLIHEDRPAALVAAACHSAIESGCRAAMAQAGLWYDGDVDRALATLAAPLEVRPVKASLTGAARLAVAERVIGWLAAFLKSEVPEKTWGY